MDKDELKVELISRISKIEDVNKLVAIQKILDMLDEENFNFEDLDNTLEPEDYGGYIKEWIKKM